MQANVKGIAWPVLFGVAIWLIWKQPVAKSFGERWGLATNPSYPIKGLAYVINETSVQSGSKEVSLSCCWKYPRKNGLK